MNILFINSTFRDSSRTRFLAKEYLKRYTNYQQVDLSDKVIAPLTQSSLQQYLTDVSHKDFTSSRYNYAKQFAQADEIIIAAPFYNFSIPATLHCYLENICVQGITFDLDQQGNYISLCRAKKLIYITTAGGAIPSDQPGFAYLKHLNQAFFHIEEIRCYQADGLDLWDNQPQEILQKAIQQF